MVSNLHGCKTSEVLIRKDLQLLLLGSAKKALFCAKMASASFSSTPWFLTAHTRRVKLLWSLGTRQTEEEQQALTREEAKLNASTPNVLCYGHLVLGQVYQGYHGLPWPHKVGQSLAF